MARVWACGCIHGPYKGSGWACEEHRDLPNFPEGTRKAQALKGDHGKTTSELRREVKR